jgi:predicted RNase H-like HicB family nuclease
MEEASMTHYVALIAGQNGAYDVVFPDCPGCVAHGRTIDEAHRRASTELSRWLRDQDASHIIRPVARSQATLLANLDFADAVADGALMMSVGASALQDPAAQRPGMR